MLNLVSSILQFYLQKFNFVELKPCRGMDFFLVLYFLIFFPFFFKYTNVNDYLQEFMYNLCTYDVRTMHVARANDGCG